MTDPTLIATPRFDLRSFDTAVFDALIAGDTVRAGAGLEATVPVSWRSAEERALAVQRDRLQQDADAARWLMRAIVRRSDRVMVGHIGFHGAPGMEHLESIAPGGVEIGYTVFPEFRGQGDRDGSRAGAHRLGGDAGRDPGRCVDRGRERAVVADR